MRVIKSAQEGDMKYIIHLLKLERETIGFLPKTVYEEEIDMQRKSITLDICFENGDPVGFLYANHGKNGMMKVYQICIQEDARRHERATALLEKSITKRDNYITLRCAEDLEANLFWESLDFEVINKLNANNKRNRCIYVYEKELILPKYYDKHSRKYDGIM